MLVRDIESNMVKKLRRRPAAKGVTVEEAHRRLRGVPAGNEAGSQEDFLVYLRSIPAGGPVGVPRSYVRPRRNKF